jgi:phage terminase large subunit-like protein
MNHQVKLFVQVPFSVMVNNDYVRFMTIDPFDFTNIRFVTRSEGHQGTPLRQRFANLTPAARNLQYLLILEPVLTQQ